MDIENMPGTHLDHQTSHNKGDHDLGPYWKRAHKDWRFWVGVLLLTVAIAVYVMSDNLRFAPHN